MTTLTIIIIISIAAVISLAILVVSSSQKKRKESLNAITALLRTLPTGEQQKALGDSLACAGDLSAADLQQTNLQYVYLGDKADKIKMVRTDMYMADLSYAVFENVDASGAIFTYANLTGAKFVNVLLLGANFSQAVNVPSEIKSHLNEKGICVYKEAVSTNY